MMRVRSEDFGSGVFISQFYRRQQSAGSFFLLGIAGGVTSERVDQ
jgi:hypothetical protein